MFRGEDLCSEFYFALSGTLKVMVRENNQDKLSKSVDQNDFFGHSAQETKTRNSFAVATSPMELICFDTAVYRKLISHKILS